MLAINFPNGDFFRGVVKPSVVVGNNIPTAGTSGYMPRCIFIKKALALGQATQWDNTETVGSCSFVPVGPVAGYGIKLAGGPVTSVGGDTTEIIISSDLINSTDIAFCWA